jgi:hypothetical protein
MYQIIGADGKQYGPVSAEQIRQWIAEGRVTAQTQVFAQGSSGWKPLGTLPEFGDLLKPIAPQPFSTAQYGSAAVPKTNSMAMTGMIMGILSITLGLCCYSMPFSILGIVFSLVGLSQIKNNPGQQGRGMAITGLILSILSLLIAIALVTIIGMTSILPQVLRDVQK